MEGCSYEAQWQKDRQRWYVMIAIFLAGFPTVLAAELLRLAHPVPEVSCLAWFILCVWAVIRYDPRCPRCGKSMIKPTPWKVVLFADRCITCGLSRGAKCDPNAN